MAQWYAGADGCRGGWIAATLDAEGFRTIHRYEALADLVSDQQGAAALLVDIPMGLKEAGAERRCDLETRRLLGRRGSTLFRVPVRAAVYAADYKTASRLNRESTGKGLSIQAYGICPKIAEADRLLRKQPDLERWVYESHPEACFTVLNGWQPLLEPKKSPTGQQRRLGLLSRHAANAGEAYTEALDRFPRAIAARDDLLDAMVLALSARLARAASMPTLPAEPERDPYGLRMAIALPAQTAPSPSARETDTLSSAAGQRPASSRSTVSTDQVEKVV